MGEGHDRPEPSLIYNIGAFFGHIVQAIKEDPAADGEVRDTAEPNAAAASGATASEATASEESSGATPETGPDTDRDILEVRREVQEARHGEYLLRRTTIDEVVRLPDGEQPGGPDQTKDSTQ
jgi:hypothetical protein